MRKRNVLVAILFCLVTTGVMSGCEKTPEDVIVTEKKKDNMANYETAEDTETKIREAMAIPDSYQNEVSSEDGRLVIDTDATISVPDVGGMNTIAVSAIELDQDKIDKVTKALFGERPIYSEESYYAATKEECQQNLEELKQAVAEGNMEAFGYEPGEEVNEEDVNAIIAEAEQNVAEASETVELEEVKPELGAFYEGEDVVWKENSRFGGVVEMEGAMFSYELLNSREFMMDTSVKLSRHRDNKETGEYGSWFATKEK